MPQIYCNIHKELGMDSCDQCDHYQAKLWRVARVAVQIRRDVLTSEGEITEESAWRDVEQALQKALDGISSPPRPAFYPGTIKVSFEEWEGEPEEVK